MKCKLYVFGLSILMFPVVLLASPVAADPGTPKDIWLEQVKSGVSVPVCKSFVEDESIASQMKARDISYEKCVSLLPGITNQCLQKNDAKIPALLNDDMAEKWGHVIGECIGNDFAVTYLYSDTNKEADQQKVGL